MEEVCLTSWPNVNKMIVKDSPKHIGMSREKLKKCYDIYFWNTYYYIGMAKDLYPYLNILKLTLLEFSYGYRNCW